MTSIYRGDNTGAFGNDFLRIYLKAPAKLIITKAVVQINNTIDKIFEYPKFPLRVNFTGEETNYLEQQNTCRMALWDEYGRRRTAEGKFNFYVKENRINEPDAPFGDPEEGEIENSITFDLDSSEITAEFVINATPTKMSELEQDVEFLGFDKIKGGRNVHTFVNEDDQLVIDADLETKIYYENVEHKPKINGQVLEGDITVTAEQVNSDWDATSGVAKILNKPNFADVAYSGDYRDLVGTPENKTKLSQFENDMGFINKDTGSLTNYYPKNVIDDKLDVLVDLDPVYEAIDNVDTALTEKIELVEEQIGDFVDVDTFTARLEEKADQRDLVDGLATKLPTDSLGIGKLKVNVNEQRTVEFSANEFSDKTLDLTIPTKLSDLTQDIPYVKEGEIVLEGYVKEDELNERLADYVTPDEIGHGILTIKRNGNNLGAFSANADINQSIDIEVPTKLSQLHNDISVVTDDDLEEITTDLSSLQSKVTTCEDNITAIQEELPDKVDKENGKVLIPLSELNRLSTVNNYDDTDVKAQLNQHTQDITVIENTLNGKVDRIPGKGLSENDYTDSEKNQLQVNTEDIDDLKIDVTRLQSSDETQNDSIAVLQDNVSDLQQGLLDEAYIRQQRYIELDDKINGLTTKATVVDVVQNVSDLDDYDKSELKVGDSICVLDDEEHEHRTSYYKLNDDREFVYVGSEGKYYTTDVADAKFVPQTRTINGFTLDRNVEITTENIGAAVPSDIKDGICTLQVEPQSVSHIDEVTEIETFSANSETNKTFRVPIPTKTSHLLNDNQFVDQDTLDGEVATINVTTEGLRTDLDGLQQEVDEIEAIIIGDVSGLAKVARTGNYEDLVNKPILIERSGQLRNDIGFVQMREVDTSLNNRFYMEDILDEFEDRVKVKKVSELENDRGYVTNSGIGRGVLTFEIGGSEIGTWMANEKYDQTLTIPVDDTINGTSTFPVQNKIIHEALGELDTAVVHKAGTETITGAKTFTADTTFTGDVIASKNVALNDNSNKVVTTSWINDFTDTSLVHKSGNITETITGAKTFNGQVTLSNATGVTTNLNDNSNNLATTKFVKDQGYCTDANVVHKTGNEIISGNKTFNDTTTFNGVNYLSQYTHVPTPIIQTEDDYYTDLAVNVNYVSGIRDEIAQDIDDAVAPLSTQIQNAVTTLNTRIDNEVIELNTTINAKEYSLGTAIVNTRNALAQDIQAVQDDLDDFKRESQSGKSFIHLTDGVNYLVLDGYHELTPTAPVTLILPTVPQDDNYYHEILVQLNLTDNYDVDLNATETLSGAGVYDVTYKWHHAAQRWNCIVVKYDN